MPLQYLDLSALLKRYVAEAGSAWVGLLVQTEPIAISRLAIVELASALARRSREGLLTMVQRDGIYQQFLTEAESFVVAELTEAVVEDAAALLLQVSVPRRLRALDALHVATAQRMFAEHRGHGQSVGAFISADRALLEAARWLGLSAENPEEHP